MSYILNNELINDNYTTIKYIMRKKKQDLSSFNQQRIKKFKY